MSRDIRGTKLQDELFVILGDFSNPTSEMFATLFARHKDSKPKYNPDDLIEIGPEQYNGVKPKSTTTVGIYMINKFLIEPLKVFNYINKPFDSKIWGDLENTIADALMAKDITTEQVSSFIDRTQFLLGGPLAHIINPSISSTLINLPASSKKLKQELLKEKKNDLDKEDAQVAASIEKEVVSDALKSMHQTDDPALSLFDSGAIDPYNNYKTMFVMKGAVKDNTGESSSGYKIVTSAYNEGITKEDMPKISDSLVTSAYSKGVATQDSGTLGKKYNAVFQRIKLQPANTDCGTKTYLKTVITKRHLYRYIVEKDKLILLTPENISNYVGKVCDLRTPLHCHAPDPEYCSKCVGDRLYRIGVKNVGLTFNIVSGSTLNASMKAFHDSRVKTTVATVRSLLKYVE